MVRGKNAAAAGYYLEANLWSRINLTRSRRAVFLCQIPRGGTSAYRRPKCLHLQRMRGDLRQLSHTPIEIERIRDASLTVEMERSPNQSAAVRRVSYQIKIAAPVPTAPAAGWKAWS